MKTTALKNTIQKGFTLIELLVVIGILGILATALVATVDPFEQLKKAQDANVKNALVEYLNANLRFYTTHNIMPWGTVAEGGFSNCASNDGTITAASMLTNPCVTGLIQDGELKTQFADATNLTRKIIVTGTSNTITACYQPESKAQVRDLNTKYLSNGVTAGVGVCDTNPGSNACYWCANL